MLFMLATTVDAACENIFGNYLPQRSLNGTLNALLTGIMLVLVLIIVADSVVKWFYLLKEHGFVTRRAERELKTREKDEALELDI